MLQKGIRRCIEAMFETILWLDFNFLRTIYQHKVRSNSLDYLSQIRIILNAHIIIIGEKVNCALCLCWHIDLSRLILTNSLLIVSDLLLLVDILLPRLGYSFHYLESRDQGNQ